MQRACPIPEIPRNWLCQAAGIAPCKGVGVYAQRKSLGVFLVTGCYIARYKSFRITRTPATP